MSMRSLTKRRQGRQMAEAKSYRDQIDLFESFDEGTELTDGISLLLSGISILKGINYDFEVELILLVIKKMLTDYCTFCNSNVLWDDYDRINSDLYKYLMGCEKLSKDEFEQNQDG